MSSSCTCLSHALPQTGFTSRKKAHRRVTYQIEGTAVPSGVPRSFANYSLNGSYSFSSKLSKIDNQQVLRNKSLICYAAKEGGNQIIGLSEKSSIVVSPIWQKVNIIYRFCRPYVLWFQASNTLSISLLPIMSISDLSLTYLVAVLQTTIAVMLSVIFTAGINSITDLKIDEINKPDHAPIASGEFSIQEGLTITILSAITSIGIGVISQSPALLLSLISYMFFCGICYSIDLPFLRWKKSPLMVAITPLVVVTFNHFSIFIHFQKYVLGKPVALTNSTIISYAFFLLTSVVNFLFLKDLPDVDGDRANGIITLSVRLGKEKSFKIAFYSLMILYGVASVFGASLHSSLNKTVMVLGNLACVCVIFISARSVDLSNNKSLSSFRLLHWKLLHVACILFPFLR